MPRCAICGKENSQKNKFCSGCGQVVSTKTIISEQAPQKKSALDKNKDKEKPLKKPPARIGLKIIFDKIRGVFSALFTKKAKIPKKIPRR